MNASDDRSVEIFRKVIDDVTQSKSEIFQDGRPNCLVIDEIDGAPAVRDFVFFESFIMLNCMISICFLLYRPLSMFLST
jgi:hypothetical protein